jgi:ABC-2 type transport system permease protein
VTDTQPAAPTPPDRAAAPAATPAPVVAAPPIGAILRALLRADLVAFVKNRRSLLLSVLLPVILLFSTNTQRGEQRLGGSLLIIGLCATYGLVSTSLLGYALAVARDREKGVFQRLRVTPAPSWAIMGSRMAVQMVANLVISLIVVVAGARLHNLSLSPGQYLLTLAVSLLGGAVFLGLGQALVGLVRSADAVNAAGRLVYIVLIFLGLLGLEGTLGTALQDVARWSPVGALMTLYAAAIHPAAWAASDTWRLLACVGYLVAGAAVGVAYFRWDTR